MIPPGVGERVRERSRTSNIRLLKTAPLPDWATRTSTQNFRVLDCCLASPADFLGPPLRSLALRGAATPCAKGLRTLTSPTDLMVYYRPPVPGGSLSSPGTSITRLATRPSPSSLTTGTGVPAVVFEA